MKKLNSGEKHIIELIDRDADADGWAPVSDVLYPHLSKNIPEELVIFDGEAGGYRARLTDEGKNIIKAMAWL